MIDKMLFVLILLPALGCGLMAGVFFAFSAFVMNALERLPPGQGIAAMKSTNVAVINPLFIAAFLGTAAACALLAVSALFVWQTHSAVYLLTSGLLYLIGTMLVTFVFNVPLNEALTVVDPESAEGASLWARYVTNWTAWNHVRTVAAMAASVLLIIALMKA